jgi:hypothetical protein
MDENDLTDYEALRLANIKRNEEFLVSLGLDKVKPQNEIQIQQKKKEKKQSHRVVLNKIPTRSSKRLKAKEADELGKEGEDENQDEDEDGQDLEAENITIDYAEFPTEADWLDDFEFQIFVNLKKWRMAKARELELTEAYKIFPNRVLCEIIRRRRNNTDWAGKSDRESLVECWGIGPGKMASGLAVELVEKLEEKESLDALEKSRKLKTFQKQ